MTDKHFVKIGKAMGVEFKGIYDEDLGIHSGYGLGDKCSRVESLARVGLRDLETQYNYSNENDLSFHAVKQYQLTLRSF